MADHESKDTHSKELSITKEEQIVMMKKAQETPIKPFKEVSEKLGKLQNETIEKFRKH